MPKFPVASPVVFLFVVNSSRISLLSNDGTEIMGPEMSTIRCQGQYLRMALVLLFDVLPSLVLLFIKKFNLVTTGQNILDIVGLMMHREQDSSLDINCYKCSG